MFKNLSKLIPTIIFVLLAVIGSMMLLSYFNVSMLDNNNKKLSRTAVFEGMKETMIIETDDESDNDDD